jgi:hypothetical protein
MKTLSIDDLALRNQRIYHISKNFERYRAIPCINEFKEKGFVFDVYIDYDCVYLCVVSLDKLIPIDRRNVKLVKRWVCLAHKQNADLIKNYKDYIDYRSSFAGKFLFMFWLSVWSNKQDKDFILKEIETKRCQ